MTSTLLSTDIVAYASANMPTDDITTSGGAVDTKMRIQFQDLPSPSSLQIFSSSGSDTMVVTVDGRSPEGTYVTGTGTMAGTTPLFFNQATYAHILRIFLASDATGTITVQSNDLVPVIVAIIPPGERGFTSMFFKAAGDPLSDVVRYEKFFWKNNNGVDNLHGVVLSPLSDPQGAFWFAVAPSMSDSGSVANRLTSPGLTFTRNRRNGPASHMNPGDSLGIWVRQTIPAGIDGYSSTYTTQLAGYAVP